MVDVRAVAVGEVRYLMLLVHFSFSLSSAENCFQPGAKDV